MSILFSIFAAVVIVAVSGEVSASPTDIARTFVKMDVERARLTPQGWHIADTLFDHSSEPAKPKLLIVIARHYSVREIANNDSGRVKFIMGYEEMGRINISALLRTGCAIDTKAAIEVVRNDNYETTARDFDVAALLVSSARREFIQWLAADLKKRIRVS